MIENHEIAVFYFLFRNLKTVLNPLFLNYFTYTLGGLDRILATISFLLVDASSQAS